MRSKSLLLLTVLALWFVGCSKDSPVAPDPAVSPSPSPSPTPSPAASACDVLRADIIATRTDKGHVDEVVLAWPLGVVPTLTLHPKFRGTREETATCPEIDIVSWQMLTGVCSFHGNFNSARVQLQCFDSGDIIVKAVAQGYTIEPAIAGFRVQGPG